MLVPLISLEQLLFSEARNVLALSSFVSEGVTFILSTSTLGGADIK